MKNEAQYVQVYGRKVWKFILFWIKNCHEISSISHSHNCVHFISIFVITRKLPPPLLSARLAKARSKSMEDHWTSLSQKCWGLRSRSPYFFWARSVLPLLTSALKSGVVVMLLKFMVSLSHESSKHKWISFLHH